MIVGKEPTLLSVKYIPPAKRSQSRDKQKECFQVVYLDDNGKVRYSDEPPLVDIYVVKPEYRDYVYNKPEERIERCDEIQVPFSQIRDKIIELSGTFGKNVVLRSQTERDFRLLNRLYRWQYAYVCDFQAEFYYMKRWYKKYPLKTPKLTSAYLDIEIDQIDYMTDMDNITPDTAVSPVNAASIVLDETKEAFMFVLAPYVPSKQGYRHEEYERRFQLYQEQVKQHEYLINHQEEFIETCHKEFDPVYGKLKYKLRIYESELDLIADLFRLINKRKPNFCLCWNMRFDINYLICRLMHLGVDPKSVLCHPDFDPNTAQCHFHVDRTNFEIAKQFDIAYITSYTQYVCQMRLYSGIRKSQHTLKSNKLNDVADKELKDKKVDYSDEGGNIMMFPYRNWAKFIIYNLKDTLLQFGIGNRTHDIVTYYMRSHKNLTPYNKIFRETHLLRNVREMYFEKDGWVQGNNLNRYIETLSEQAKEFYGDDAYEDGNIVSGYKGAINADPIWNDRIGMKVMGVKSNNLFANGIDMDMGAFYPSIKIASNMDPITLLCKAAFVNAEFISLEYTNRSLNQTYRERDKNNRERDVDITGHAVDTWCSGNILTFGYNYLNMPSIRKFEEAVANALGTPIKQAA